MFIICIGTQVRFAYNVYFHFWPLTRHIDFDMKDLWLKQEDHSKPFPFPGHDVTYGNIRERVPYDNQIVPDRFFMKVALSKDSPLKDQLINVIMDRW